MKQNQQVLIYCRVSTKRQENDGHGLDSQEHRCREYARQKEYEVAEVFRDSSSGGGDFLKRPAMSELLAFLDTHPEENYVVVFDDLKRFARDTLFHWKLRTELDTRGARPECLNFNFEETPEGEFIETILAAQGELERKQNRRQIIQKMKARLEAGYWPFYPPPGYVQEKRRGQGKVLVFNEPDASHIREALEGFASGRFATQGAVRRFLQSNNFRPHVYMDQVKRILRRLVYAGKIEYLPWKVTMRDGMHEPLISLKTFQRIQKRLAVRAPRFKAEHIREAFPLRGFVTCSRCRHPLTASFSRGRRKHYPYYHCHIRTCPARGQTISKSWLEGVVVNMLKDVEIQANVLALGKRVIEAVAGDREHMSASIRGQELAEAKQIVEEVAVLAGRCATTNSEALVRVYEAKIEELERRRQVLESEDPQHTRQAKAGTPSEEIFGLLKNPYEAWLKGDVRLRTLVLSIVFDGPFEYDRESEAGTPDFSYGVRLLQRLQSQTTQDVEIPPHEWNDLDSWLRVVSETVKENFSGCLGSPNVVR